MASEIYSPLDTARHEIRVLRILPATNSTGFIECSFECISLDDEPIYHALSYSWQDECLGMFFVDPDHPPDCIMLDEFVILQGQIVDVTPNLWLALWHFRRAAKWHLDHPDSTTSEFGDYGHFENGQHAILLADTVLWVDALCINQDDSQERSAQVQMMGDLYAKAACVHIWLGEAPRFTGLMIEMFTDIQDHIGGIDIEQHRDIDNEHRKFKNNCAEWSKPPNMRVLGLP